MNEFPLTHRRVIVADDLPPILTAVTDLLRGTFDVIETVSDGKAALDAVLALQPDLAVLDISMPGMSGLEVAKRLQNCGTATKIVFLTVQEDSRIIAACLSAGGLGYVVKELMDGDLIPALKEALEGRVFVSRLSAR
jgi:DNA-binding NarL/FixJ family response regulator